MDQPLNVVLDSTFVMSEQKAPKGEEKDRSRCCSPDGDPASSGV